MSDVRHQLLQRFTDVTKNVAFSGYPLARYLHQLRRVLENHSDSRLQTVMAFLTKQLHTFCEILRKQRIVTGTGIA